MTVAPNGLGGYGGQPRRIVIEHRTGYRYEKPVLASYNEARLTPITTIGQTALDARVIRDLRRLIYPAPTLAVAPSSAA